MLVTQQRIATDAQARKSGRRNLIKSRRLYIPTELDVGPYEQRLCYTILVNEFNGAEKALDHLQTTDQRVVAADFELTENQQKLRDTLGKLLDNYVSGNLQSAKLS